MGWFSSKDNGRRGSEDKDLGRQPAVTDRAARAPRPRPPGCKPSSPADWPLMQEALARVSLLQGLSAEAQSAVVREMYERPVAAGEILIQEGDSGAAASELYVVRSGQFEVLQRPPGAARGAGGAAALVRVNTKGSGSAFGEIALLYSQPRTATVAALVDSVVWVLERGVLRGASREGRAAEASRLVVFLNSVPLLAKISAEQRAALAEALEEREYPEGAEVVRQGDPGDLFLRAAGGARGRLASATGGWQGGPQASE